MGDSLKASPPARTIHQMKTACLSRQKKPNVLACKAWNKAFHPAQSVLIGLLDGIREQRGIFLILENCYSPRVGISLVELNFFFFFQTIHAWAILSSIVYIFLSCCKESLFCQPYLGCTLHSKTQLELNIACRNLCGNFNKAKTNQHDSILSRKITI